MQRLVNRMQKILQNNNGTLSGGYLTVNNSHQCNDGGVINAKSTNADKCNNHSCPGSTNNGSPCTNHTNCTGSTNTGNGCHLVKYTGGSNSNL
jgi:hypothetical protein